MPDAFFFALAESLQASATHDWRARARPAQLPPTEFSIWLLLAGRGFGKSWTGANYVCEVAGTGAARRIALIAPTADHARATMVEGESGILNVAPHWSRPVFEASKGQLTWPSGSIAVLYSADSPEVLRGPEHDFAWADELAAWRRPETWDNLLLTLRIGTPRVVVTSTPKPTRLIRDLVAREGTDGIIITRGSTYDNKANLAPQFLSQLVRRYEGTRLGRQELMGEVLDDVPGALWTRETLDETRVDAQPQLQRIVIGVDPAGSSAAGADMTGIVACGIGQDGHAYLIADLSCRGTPREWAGKAIGAYHSLRADKIVVERNYGGEMAAATLSSVDPAVPIKEISSSRGKILRAEPVASLFEQKRAHVVGSLSELEDQMCSFTADWDRSRDGSPDRVDAMVFAVAELMLNRPIGGFFREAPFLVDGQPIEMPCPVDCVYAVVATVKPAEDQAIGLIYCASVNHVGPSHGIVVLDWDLVSIEEALAEAWLPGTFERLESFGKRCKSVQGIGGVWAEATGVCEAILQSGNEREFRVVDINEWLVQPSALNDRAAAASSWMDSGKVKVTRTAHERLLPFSGVTRNHLLAQILGFRIGGGAEEAGELLTALCSAIAMANPAGPPPNRARS